MAVNRHTLAPAGLFRDNNAWMSARAGKSLPPDHVEDTVQEAYVRVLAAKKLPELVNVAAYLSRTLDHQVAAHYRSVKSLERFVERFEQTNPTPTVLPDVADGYEIKERQDQVRRALATLRPRQRRAMELLAQGNTVAKIAAQMGIPPRSVTAILFRAKANLKRQLLKGGFIPSAVPVWLEELTERAQSRVAQLTRYLQSLEIPVWQMATVAAALAILPLTVLGPHPEQTTAREPAALPVAAPPAPAPVAPAVAVPAPTEPKASALSESVPPAIPSVAAEPPAIPPADPSPPAETGEVSEDISAPYTSYNVSGEDNVDDPPPPLEQIQHLVEHPGELLPTCDGLVTCPAL